MNTFILLAFLFMAGSLLGWCIEVLFRKRFSSDNPEHKWVNPGFLTGPYLPLYGFGLTALYLIASLENYDLITSPFWNKIVLFLFMALCMTVIEYIAGLVCVKILKVKLWDYSDCWGNIQGIICPLFSFFWAILGALYYFLVHPYILGALEWLSNNLAFSFAIGFFYGIFLLDLVQSTRMVVRLKRFADEKQILIRYEDLKEHLRQVNFSNKVKLSFFFSMLSELRNEDFMREVLEDQREKKRAFVENFKQKLPKEIQEYRSAKKQADKEWRRQSGDENELWDVYDEKRRLTGRTHRRGDPLEKGERHLVVHVWLLNSQGQFLLTKRTPNKTFPDMWESTGGSALAGEDSLSAALREVREETGLRPEPEKGQRLISLKRRDYFCDVWLFEQDFSLEDVVLQEGETCGACYAGREEILEMLREKSFVPYEYLDELFAKVYGKT